MANYVLVSTDTADKVIKAGPFLWDGTREFVVPSGQQTMLASDAAAGGYTFPPRPVTETNEADLRAKAENALAGNASYLAIGTPSNAQNLAQIRALTRQCTALIRLQIGALDTTDGT